MPSRLSSSSTPITMATTPMTTSNCARLRANFAAPPFSQCASSASPARIATKLLNTASPHHSPLKAHPLIHTAFPFILFNQNPLGIVMLPKILINMPHAFLLLSMPAFFVGICKKFSLVAVIQFDKLLLIENTHVVEVE